MKQLAVWAWVNNNEKPVALCGAILCLVAMFALKPVKEVLAFLCLVFSWCIYCLHKKIWVLLIAFLVVLPVSIYAGADLIWSRFIDCTFQSEFPHVDAFVVPGGDRISLNNNESYFMATVCFYIPDTDMCVVAAHYCKGIEPHQVMKASVSFSTNPELVPDVVYVNVVSNTEKGLVLSGTGCLRNDVETVGIGGIDHIAIGKEASLHIGGGTVVPVEVLGFFEGVLTGSAIVVKVLEDHPELGPGASGSPLFQDGKLIGCFTGIFRFPYEGARVLSIRPACEIYSEFEEFWK